MYGLAAGDPAVTGNDGVWTDGIGHFSQSGAVVGNPAGSRPRDRVCAEK